MPPCNKPLAEPGSVDPDLCNHMVSLGHNELILVTLVKTADIFQVTIMNTFSRMKTVKFLKKLTTSVNHQQACYIADYKIWYGCFGFFFGINDFVYVFRDQTHDQNGQWGFTRYCILIVKLKSRLWMLVSHRPRGRPRGRGRGASTSGTRNDAVRGGTVNR